MSEFHKRMRRGSVNKLDRFPSASAQAAAPERPSKPGGSLFELRRSGSGDKENAPSGANDAGGRTGGMGLLIPMLGCDDGAGHCGGGKARRPPQLFDDSDDDGGGDRCEMAPPRARASKRDSMSSIASGMSLCFDETEPPQQQPQDAPGPRLDTVHEQQPRGGGGILSPPRMVAASQAGTKPSMMGPRPSRPVPSIPPRLGGSGSGVGSPPKVSLSRRPVRVAGFKRRDITPPAPFFDGRHGCRSDNLMNDDGPAAAAAQRLHDGGVPASPAKALRLSSFAAQGGPPAPGLSGLFGDEMDGSSSPPGGRRSPEASPRKLPFSFASSSTPRSSPKPSSDPYAAPGGARGMFQSPHWSNAVHINPFSPVPTEYLSSGAPSSNQRDESQPTSMSSSSSTWAPPPGSVNGMFYSARGSPLGADGASDRAAAAAAASASRRKTPRRPLRTPFRTQLSDPFPESDPLPEASPSCYYNNRPPVAQSLALRRASREASALAVDTSMESEGSGGGQPSAKISPTDVMSFAAAAGGTPPTPAKKPSGRPLPDFGLAGSSPPRSGSPAALAAPGSPRTCRKERRPPPLNRVGPGRSFDMEDDLDDMVSPRPARSRRCSNEADDVFGATVRSPLPQCTVSRFEQDFQVVGQLGTGSFGTVHKVISRLDGCLYAVKVMKRPVRGELDRRQTLKEVHALAALCSQSDASAFHIVRYHQAWMEDNLLHIQTELCTSTLPHEMAAGMLIDEDRRFKLLREMLLALELIHKNEMVHLDIKPENIFIKNDQFKLGDFGLASKLTNSSDVEEGDSRYMSQELLSGDSSDLTKCDIFSLGATMYEICLGRSLPADGPEWADIRSGKMSVLRRTHPAMVEMVRDMMHPDPARRPCASALLTRRQLLSDEQKLLLLEKNRAKEASLALAAQERKLQMMGGGAGGPPRRKKLIRSTSCSLY